jgi:hypothetical protein
MLLENTPVHLVIANNMQTLYFCLEGAPAVIREWDSVPRIGETVALPELGGNLNPLRVFDVIWEGTIEPVVSVYVHHAKVQHVVCNDVPHHSMRNGASQNFLPTNDGG